MENKSSAPVAQVLVPAVSEIRSLLEVSRKNVAQQVNQELLSTYWKIGEVVVRCEQNDSIRAAYGEKTLSQLSRALTKELGKGFSRSNVYNMRQFYLSYPIFQTVSGKLSWSHYCELLSISDKEKRSFYEKEAVNSGWSVREMKRQVESSLFERLLLSRGDANKEQVLALAEKGVDYTKPEDIIKDPYVFEFLGLPEEKPFLESDLEAALVRQIEDFLLELGRGFMFVGTQQRVTVNNTHYYVDMVFYNKILHAYVLIELKTTKLTPEAAGQINMYLNYYAAEVNDPEDNPPIGIILCTDKDSVAAEYALGGLSNQIFASRYVLYMRCTVSGVHLTGGMLLHDNRAFIGLSNDSPILFCKEDVHNTRRSMTACSAAASGALCS
jgi:predicted nuclease of restriction endonuclease-like (RecB) superfamily